MFVELHKFLCVFAVEVDYSSAYEVLNAEKYIVCNIKQLCAGYAFAVINGVIFAELCYQESGGHVLACRFVEACKAFESFAGSVAQIVRRDHHGFVRQCNESEYFAVFWVANDIGDRYFPAGKIYSPVAYEILYLWVGRT